MNTWKEWINNLRAMTKEQFEIARLRVRSYLEYDGEATTKENLKCFNNFYGHVNALVVALDSPCVCVLSLPWCCLYFPYIFITIYKTPLGSILLVFYLFSHAYGMHSGTLHCEQSYQKILWKIFDATFGFFFLALLYGFWFSLKKIVWFLQDMSRNATIDASTAIMHAVLVQLRPNERTLRTKLGGD